MCIHESASRRLRRDHGMLSRHSVTCTLALTSEPLARNLYSDISFAPADPEDKVPDQGRAAVKSHPSLGHKTPARTARVPGPRPSSKRHLCKTSPVLLPITSLPSSIYPFPLISSSISHPHAGHKAWNNILKYLWVLFHGSVSMATALKERRKQIDFHPERNQGSWNVEVPGRYEGGGGHKGQ